MVVVDREGGEAVAVAGPTRQKVDLILVQNWRRELARLVSGDG